MKTKVKIGSYWRIHGLDVVFLVIGQSESVPLLGYISIMNQQDACRTMKSFEIEDVIISVDYG